MPKKKQTRKRPDVPSQSCGACHYFVRASSECAAFPGLRRVVPPTKTCPVWTERTGKTKENS